MLHNTAEEVFDILFARVEAGQMKVEKADLPAALRCPVVGLDTIAGTELEKKKTKAEGGKFSQQHSSGVCTVPPATLCLNI